jgi:hypothetical protein
MKGKGWLTKLISIRRFIRLSCKTIKPELLSLKMPRKPSRKCTKTRDKITNRKNKSSRITYKPLDRPTNK